MRGGGGSFAGGMYETISIVSVTQPRFWLKLVLLNSDSDAVDRVVLRKKRGPREAGCPVRLYLEEGCYCNPETAEPHKEEATNHKRPSAQMLDRKTLQKTETAVSSVQTAKRRGFLIPFSITATQKKPLNTQNEPSSTVTSD